MKTSPTQRSLKLLRDQGYTCAIVEHWNPFAHIRQDLFGFIDIMAIKEGETLGVQTTTLAHQPERVVKIKEHKNYPIVRLAGWKIHVHGWRKLKAGWIPKIIEL